MNSLQPQSKSQYNFLKNLQTNSKIKIEIQRIQNHQNNFEEEQSWRTRNKGHVKLPSAQTINGPQQRRQKQARTHIVSWF